MSLTQPFHRTIGGSRQGAQVLAWAIDPDGNANFTGTISVGGLVFNSGSADAGTSGQVAYYNSAGILVGDSGLTYTANGGPFSTTGVVRTGNGSAGSAAYSFTARPGAGLRYVATDNIFVDLNSLPTARFTTSRVATTDTSGNFIAVLPVGSSAGTLRVRSIDTIGFSSSATDADTAADTLLARDAANTLAQRNGVNSQAFNVYNTFTDASNFEYGFISWRLVSNVLEIGGTYAGTGVSRNLRFTTDGGSSYWQIAATTPSLTPSADNSYTIGDATHRAAGVYSPAFHSGATAMTFATSSGDVTALTLSLGTGSANVATFTGRVDANAYYQAGSAGVTANVTTGALVGKTITIINGLVVGFS